LLLFSDIEYSSGHGGRSENERCGIYPYGSVHYPGFLALIIAVCGEDTERAGVVNLSLDGTMLMAAMAGFVAGLKTENVWLGFLPEPL
jgi:hypothetical protein